MNLHDILQIGLLLCYSYLLVIPQYDAATQPKQQRQRPGHSEKNGNRRVDPAQYDAAIDHKRLRVLKRNPQRPRLRHLERKRNHRGHPSTAVVPITMIPSATSVRMNLTAASTTHSFHNGSESDATWLPDCPVERNTSCHCYFNSITCSDEGVVPYFRDDSRNYTSLNLGRQHISALSAAAFFPLRVHSINLDFNPLSSLDAAGLEGLENCLITITMTGCQLSTLPMGLLKDMKHLLMLSIAQNFITNIPSRFFQDALQLEKLFVWGNRLQELHSSALFGLMNLRKLDLDGNNISKITEDTFQYVPKLEVLSLGGNNIETLRGHTFRKMESLKVLNLDNNILKFVLSYAFNGIGNLLSLNLENNKIDYLYENVFKFLSQLKTLYLQANSLGNVRPSTFKGLISLRKLNLEDNKLSVLPPVTFILCKKLHYIYLDNNNLTTISKCLFHEKTRIKRLSLVGNPIHCDCAMSWLRDLHNQGVSVWGTCMSSKIGAPFGILNPDVYKVGSCSGQSSQCSRPGLS